MDEEKVYEYGENSELYHYGTPRHSGRYPWGSGKDPYQHEENFLKTIEHYKKKGMTDGEIAKVMGYSSSEFARIRTNINREVRARRVNEWQKLRDEGWSFKAIAERYGLPNESTVRSALTTGNTREKKSAVDSTADMLKARIEETPYIDVSKGSNNLMGVTESTFKNAIAKLQEQGYVVQPVYIPQVTNPDKWTTINVLTKEGVDKKDIYANKDQIKLVTEYTTADDGKTWLGIERPQSLDSSRVMVRYAEDGGTEKDGVIELRRGVEDISLGNSNYAQVRIAVDDTHYMKGMATYAADTSDWPDGVDVVYNAHYTKDIPALGTDKDNTVLKLLKKDKETGEVDWANPFGATIKTEDGIVVGQRHYIDENGKEQLSSINIIKEQGDWNKWSKALSSQFLSKQYDTLIKQQLKLSLDVHKDQYDEIMELTNPEIKEQLLTEFASQCDGDAVHLKAAALPRQSTKAILPIPSLKENEIYAPTYEDGEEVILVRHPHEGTFQIPRLIVNNHSKEGKAVIGADAIDAVGIHPKAAQQMSGADFDGDTVIVIPTRGQKLASADPLPGLVGFDPQETYKAYPGMPRVGPETGFHKQTEMGKVSNLITDMTLIGCDAKEVERAVRYSMTVIDAEKHNLNWRESFSDNNIAELKEKYQGGANRGAATLISKAKSTEYVDDRKVERFTKDGKTYEFDPDTGEVSYQYTGKTKKGYFDSVSGKRVVFGTDPVSGERAWMTKDKKKTVVPQENVYEGDTGKPAQNTSTKMAEAKNAYDLSSGTKKEAMYADYANALKALANEARVESTKVGKTEYNESAKKTYEKEIESLNAKLSIAESNAPRERQAQVIATKRVEEKLKSNPSIRDDKDAIKKLRNQAIVAARNEVGASRQKSLIDFTDREWEALQSGAIRPTKIKKILANANSDQVKKLATPKNSSHTLTSGQIARIQAMSRNGATLAEIAADIGISTSSVYRALNE